VTFQLLKKIKIKEMIFKWTIVYIF